MKVEIIFCMKCGDWSAYRGSKRNWNLTYKGTVVGRLENCTDGMVQRLISGSMGAAVVVKTYKGNPIEV